MFDFNPQVLSAAFVAAAVGSQLARVGYWAPQRLEFEWALAEYQARGVPAEHVPEPVFEQPDLQARLLQGGLSALAAALAVSSFGVAPAALAAIVFLLVLQVLALADFRSQLLPDMLTLPFLWGGLLLAAAGAGFVGPAAAVQGAAVGYAALWLPAYLYKRLAGEDGLGGGDAKLLAGVGAWLGPIAAVNTLATGAVLALLVPLIALLRGNDARAGFAFGPALALAAAGSLMGAGLTDFIHWVRWG
ncbi:prepilin peptidase [Ramlibacter alkalitolerans]|uniref:Prepilin peptidase n=1 Tax=Ramlibacter alkalitolerans TaxID=2039631 RepID=A0ABS1JU40_9BURK|nr:A24 family peptidase [Ramlibacter alkalitolerans]MBL0427738.1 prepilin peptidase [Ramlibacter alkalitolerans]